MFINWLCPTIKVCVLQEHLTMENLLVDTWVAMCSIILRSMCPFLAECAAYATHSTLIWPMMSLGSRWLRRMAESRPESFV